MAKTYLDPREVGQLIQAATNLRDRLLIQLLFHLGIRITEALLLEPEDIDFSQGTVSIVHLKRWVKLQCPACLASLGRSHIYCPGCGKMVGTVNTSTKEHRRQRVLPVDTETLAMLGEFLDRGGLVVKKGEKLLFGINRHRGWQIIKEAAEKAGLPKLVNPETGRVHNVSPHRLRDSFAVNAVKHNDSGDGLRLLQEHLGHQSFNTTAKYRKVSGEEHRDWFNELWKEGDE